MGSWMGTMATEEGRRQVFPSLGCAATHFGRMRTMLHGPHRRVDEHQFHPWVYNQENWKLTSTPKLVHECSQQHYSQSPQSENNSDAHYWWMNEWNVVHPYIEILFGNKKEWRTCHNMGEPSNHHAKWKTLVTKSHMLYLYEISRIGKSINK